jgi:hypothetical protein
MARELVTVLFFSNYIFFRYNKKSFGHAQLFEITLKFDEPIEAGMGCFSLEKARDTVLHDTDCPCCGELFKTNFILSVSEVRGFRHYVFILTAKSA